MKIKFDVEKSRVFVIFDQLRFIETFVFDTNSTYKSDSNIVELPDIDS